ncbi:hypothetical protein [Hyphobacterium sp.]|uniref:hypothetical protein n=1 Tax=Hyphobacterium sp. TaxID=2004662 RepID=UPI003747B6F6
MNQPSIHIAFSPEDQSAALALWQALNALGYSVELGLQPSDLNSDQAGPTISRDATHLLLVASTASATSFFVSRSIDAFLKRRDISDVFTVWVQAPKGEQESQAAINPLLAYERHDKDGLLQLRREGPSAIGSISDDGADTVARRIASSLGQPSLSSTRQAAIIAAMAKVPSAWGAATIAGVVAITFGIWGLSQQHAADEAALQAHLARQASRQMLANLDDTLSSQARREVFSRLSDDVIALTEQDIHNVDSADLARQARLLQVIGEVRARDGDLIGAIDAYQDASDITEFLLNEAPGDPARIFDHAQSVFWIGDSALIAGDFDQASAYFETYAGLANQLVEIDAENPVYQAEWAYAQSNLGAVAIGRNERQFALEYFDRAIEGYQAGPIEAGIVSRRSLSNAYGWRAGPLRGLGRIEEAIASRSYEIEILEDLVRENPDSRHLREAWVNAFQARIDMRLDLGEVETAQSDLERVSPIIAALFEELPESRLIRRKYLENELLRAQIALYQGDTIRAQLIHNAASRDYTSGQGAALEDGRRIDLGHLDLLRARIALASGAYEASLTASIEAVADYEADLTDEGSRLRHFAAFAHFYAGEALLALGRQGDAEREWRRGLSEIEQIDPPRDLRADDVLGRLTYRLGDREEGRQRQQELIESGYARPDFVAFWAQSDDQLNAQNISSREEDDG